MIKDPAEDEKSASDQSKSDKDENSDKTITKSSSGERKIITPDDNSANSKQISICLAGLTLLSSFFYL